MPDRAQVIAAIKVIAKTDQAELLARLQRATGLRQSTKFTAWIAETVGCEQRSVYYWLSGEKAMSTTTRFALASLEVNLRLVDGSFDELENYTPTGSVEFLRYPPPK